MLRRLIKIAVFATAIAAITGCASVNVQKNYDWQGKTWSAVVVRPFVDTSKSEGFGSEADKSIGFDVARDRGQRVAMVHISSGFTSVMTNVALPDSMEFSDIPKGSLIEVMIERGKELNFAQERYNRVLRVICRIDEKECINREDKAKRIRVVLDEHPDASKLNEQYGLTFNRRLTPEELKKYK